MEFCRVAILLPSIEHKDSLRVFQTFRFVLRPGQLLLLVQALLLAWLLFLLVFSGVFRGQQLQGEIMTQGKENQHLDRRNARLLSQVEALRSGDLSVIEERARKDLGMVKDKEAFFIFVD